MRERALGAGWPTPDARDANAEGREAELRRYDKYSTMGLQTAATVDWPSPSASDGMGSRSLPAGTTATGRTPDGKKKMVGLNNAVKRSLWGDEPPPDFSSGVMWPTPNVPNGGRSMGEDISDTGIAPDGKKRQVDLATIVKRRTQESMWATPDASSGIVGAPLGDEEIVMTPSGPRRLVVGGDPGGNLAHNTVGMNVGRQVHLEAGALDEEATGVGQPTPVARDAKSGVGAQRRDGHAPPLSDVVGGQLNPSWVEGLMNFPHGWTDPDHKGELVWHGWPAGPGQRQHEYEPPRLAKKVKQRTARLKALGNAVVPAQAAPVFAAIMDTERLLMRGLAAEGEAE